MADSFKLTPAEFASLALFLHAKTIPGLAFDLSTFNQQQLAQSLESLTKKGMMTDGEQPGTHHVDESLLDAMTVIVAPQQIVLAHDIAGKRSMQFFVVADGVAAVVMTKQEVVVANFTEIRDIAEQSVAFLGDTQKGRIMSAVVESNELVKGRRIEIGGGQLRGDRKGDPFNADSVMAFLDPPEAAASEGS